MIPLSALSVARKLTSALTEPHMLRHEVANHGLGKDIWSIPFDDITYILKVGPFIEVDTLAKGL